MGLVAGVRRVRGQAGGVRTNRFAGAPDEVVGINFHDFQKSHGEQC